MDLQTVIALAVAALAALIPIRLWLASKATREADAARQATEAVRRMAQFTEERLVAKTERHRETAERVNEVRRAAAAKAVDGRVSAADARRLLAEAEAVARGEGNE